MKNYYIFPLLISVVLFLTGISLVPFLNGDSLISSFKNIPTIEKVSPVIFDSNFRMFHASNPIHVDLPLVVGSRNSYKNVVDVSNPPVIKCQGQALCLKGEVVKVTNGKSFFASVNDRIIKVDLALIALPVTNQQAMIAATTFTRNNCLGGTVLIDQDDRQVSDSIIGTVYCSPTKSLNSLLLDTGYVNLNKTQCTISEFSKLDWARSHGC